MRTVRMALLAACTALTASRALAVESWIPYLAGSRVALQLGTLPRPGIYVSSAVQVPELKGHDDNGNQTPEKVTGTLVVPAVVWVPDIKLLGATYGVELVKTMLQLTVQTPAVQLYNGGFFNTVIYPAMLSWKLPADVFVKAQFAVYIPDGSYKLSKAGSGATLLSLNYWNFQPSVGATWLHDGWNLSGAATLDVGTKNTATQYQSGQVVSFDLNVSKSIGDLTLGAGASMNQQYTDDTRNGQSVAPNGNRARDLVAGPYLGYRFGAVSASVWYTYGTATNYIEGSKLWFRIGLPVPL